MGRRDTISAIFAWVIIVGFAIVLCAVVFGIRLAITGGNLPSACPPKGGQTGAPAIRQGSNVSPIELEV